MNSELSIIKRDVNDFLLKNEKRYQIISDFQDNIVNLTNESFPTAIQHIKDNSDIFFKDHSSVMNFYFNIILFSKLYFKNLELILNICIHFLSELKRLNVTENEMMSICLSNFPVCVNYFFSKKIISIETIVEHSFCNQRIFINFLPEIEQYDPEYAQIRAKNLFKHHSFFQLIDNLKEFYLCVKSNPEKHILNRNQIYHPSPLHKSIRDDDIDAFQSLLSQNNYDVNSKIDFSFYERTETLDKDISLIQLAATYGSIKIFKFLWMQKTINLNHNLLAYAYFGMNFEIIHLCEQKCQHEDVIVQLIFLHRFDLLDYYIENYRDYIKENYLEFDDKSINFDTNDNDETNLNESKNNFKNSNEEKKLICLHKEECHNQIMNGNDSLNANEEKQIEICNDDEGSLYKCLDYFSLCSAIFLFNYRIIKPNLNRIVYIVKTVENIKCDAYTKQFSLLENCLFDVEFFKFLFEQRKPNVKMLECGNYFRTLETSEIINANDLFTFLLFNLKEKVDIFKCLINCIGSNHDIANFILDSLIKSKKSKNDGGESYDLFLLKSYHLNFEHLLTAINSYNEDIVVKMMMVFDFDYTNENINDFISELNNCLSKKMILLLFIRLSSFLPKDILTKMLKHLDKDDCSTVFNELNKTNS